MFVTYCYVKQNPLVQAMKKILTVFLIITLLSSCGGKMTKKRMLDETLYSYAKIFRWADFQTAMSYFSPEVDEKLKPTKLEIDRIKQFAVSSYVPSPILPGEDENTIIQNVKIKIYNLHTKREREIIDSQVWKYNTENKRWWLVSGLPKIVH